MRQRFTELNVVNGHCTNHHVVLIMVRCFRHLRAHRGLTGIWRCLWRRRANRSRRALD